MCVRKCVCARVWVCACVRADLQTHSRICQCVCLVCMHPCVYVCVCLVWMPVCMYVCMHVRM